MEQSAMQKLLEEVILEREKSISVEFREALDFVITAIQTDYKEMEKQQIIDFGNDLLEVNKINWNANSISAEQYYNETFNK